jgi:dipeptidyl aminopeptidase/acylaminoacyl peptidase
MATRVGFRVALLALLLVLFAGISALADKNLFTMKDVFGLVYASDPQISPDGQRIVYARTFMDIMKDRRKAHLWIVNRDGSGNRPLTSGTQSEGSARWSPDGTCLLYISSDDGKAQIFLRWMDTGQTAKLTQLTELFGDLSWSPDGKHIAFSMFVPDEPKPPATMPEKPEGADWASPARLIDRMVYRTDDAGYLKSGYWHLFLVPAEGGTPRQLTFGKFDERGRIAWTPDGKSLLFSSNRQDDWEYDPLNTEIQEISVDSGEIKPLTRRQGPDDSPIISPDGKQIAYTGFDDRFQFYQVTRLYIMNRDGSNPRVLTERLDRDVVNPVWNHDGRSICFQYNDQGKTKIARVALDGTVTDLTDAVGGTSLDRPYSEGSYSLSKNGFYAFTYSWPDRPADVGSGAIATPGAQRITALSDDFLGHLNLPKPEEIWFESSIDHRKVEGWIVKPPGFDPSHTYPLILEIHGGPVDNYGAKFAADIQLYAAAGYVVLYTNPRGSDSYGEEFGNLIHRNYPGDDYYDLMSGVDAVIAKHYVDTDNLFITGGSGGGILTAWTIGRTDRFRAAAVQKPMINWSSGILNSDINSLYRYWFSGFPWDVPEEYRKRSPLTLAGNVKTPTMVLNGEEDHRTPISEAEQYYAALKLRKIDSVLVRIPGASHDIANRPSQLITKVAYILNWFDNHRLKRTGDTR